MKQLFILLLVFTIVRTANSQVFESDPNISDPTIWFLSDSVVVMEYDSIYDVHMRLDTINYPNLNINSSFFGWYDYHRIVSDLLTVLDVREYHFVPVYGDDDLQYGTEVGNSRMPGWIHAGQGNGYGALNIGPDNTNDVLLTPLYNDWGNVRRLPHMNNVGLLDRSSSLLGDKYGKSATFFHEIAHHAGVFWHYGPHNELGWNTVNWEPWMPPLILVNTSGHWWPPQSDRWVNPFQAGLLPSAPSYLSFNWMDLYALGILTWEQIQDSSSWVRDPNTLIEYEITPESLIEILGLKDDYMNNTPFGDLPGYLQDGDHFMVDDGIRFPNGDPTMLDLKTLVVVVIGAESIFTDNDQELLMELVREIPGDWDQATHGLSQMSSEITHKKINHFTKDLNSRPSLTINIEDFQNAFNNYEGTGIRQIRFEALPNVGKLRIGNEEVITNKSYSTQEIEAEGFTYTRVDPAAIFYTDTIIYNVRTSDRWAAPARIIIEDNFVEPASIVISNNETRNESTLTYPNSFDGSLTIEFDKPVTSETSIGIFDLNGREIYTEVVKDFNPNSTKIKLNDIPKTTSNILIMIVTSGDQTFKRKLIMKQD